MGSSSGAGAGSFQKYLHDNKMEMRLALKQYMHVQNSKHSIFKDPRLINPNTQQPF